MSLRYHAVGTIAVALLLFIWGFLVHSVLHHSLESITVLEEPGESKLVALIDEIAQTPGTYFSKYGIFLSHDMTADPAGSTISNTSGKLDKSSEEAMGSFLIRQLVIDLVIAAFLSCIVLKIKAPGTLRKACCLGFIGLTAGIAACVPQWSWFGFGGLLTSLSVLDLAGGWFLGGVVLAWLADRWVVAPTEQMQ